MIRSTGPLSIVCFLLTAIVALSTSPVWAQEEGIPTVEEIASGEAATRHVRALQYARDFDLGAVRGEQLAERFPDHLELRAWYLLSKGRAGEAEAAAKAAEQMAKKNPENPWSHFALAGALNWHEKRGEEAVDVINEAVGKVPDHPDMLWLKAEVISSQVGHLEAIAFIDSTVGRVDNPAYLLAMKGYAQYAAERESDSDEGPTFEDARATYEKARQADSSCVNAYYLPGYQLLFRQQIDEAYPLMKKAAELSTAVRIHDRYWRAAMQHPGKPADEKKAEVEAGIQDLLDRRPVTPPMLHRIAAQYGEIGMTEKQKAYEDRILEEYPKSTSAGWVLVDRYRRFQREHQEALKERDPEIVAQYKGMLWDFIERPQHNEKTLIGDAYRNLFYVIRDDSTVSTDTLLQVVKGMVEYEGINPHVTHAGGAIALAERGTHFRYAEQIAREGMELAREKINEQHERGAYDTEQEYQESLGWYTGLMHDALGWVYFNEGRLADAEEQLLRAHALDDDNRENLYHLGQLYEELDKLKKAERFYTAGLAVQRPGENPNEAALEQLYFRHEGTLEGYEEYLAALKADHRSRRKQEILEARIEDPEPIPEFMLETLEGGTMSSEVARGKVTVINFWGTWCGWCVREMPDLQEFYEKYKEDPEVQMLTINYRDRPEKAREWIADKGYEFPVLLDDGYVSKNDVAAFPTTWFVGPEGQIEWIKRGWSKKLVEEFTWRVEALRGEGAR